MAKQPRKHHYVPQFYLAGFTRENSDDGTLHVLDLATKEQRPSSPKNTAHQRDYYAVHLGASQDAMGVEKNLGQIEGKQSAVLRRIAEEKTLPPDDDEAFAELLGFVAFTTVRVPRIRDILSDFMDRVSKAQLRATFATKEGRETFRRVTEAHIVELSPMQKAQVTKLLDDDPDLTQMAEYANRGEYDVTVDQTWLVQQMLEMAITLTLVLPHRKWSLWAAEDDAPDLICSDSPVCLTWATPVNGPYSPGFGVPNTFLTLPLNRRLILASAFEELPTARTLSKPEVAAMNARTMMFATQVFSPEPDFVWNTREGKIGRSVDLPARQATE